MATREGVEAVVVVCSFGIFLGYHFYLFFLRGRGSKVRQVGHIRGLTTVSAAAAAVVVTAGLMACM
jgi:alpha-beta hydrolase superfamily lysophospholipase